MAVRNAVGRALLVVFAGGTAVADDHFVRTLDARTGLDAALTTAVARDTRGFVWIGTPGGLLRYDGHTIEPWARSTIDVRVGWIKPADDGSIYVIGAAHALWHVVGTEATRIDRVPFVEDVLADADGGLLVTGDGTAHRRDPGGRWSVALRDLDRPRLLRRGPDGALWVASRSTVWRVVGDAATTIASADWITDVLPIGARDVIVLQGNGKVLACDGTRTELVFDGHLRGISLARRGDVTWVAYDAQLVALRPGRVEIIRRDGDVTSGGPLLVDREGSLWVASFQGLLQLPEPDTALLGPRDGLPGGSRRLAPSPEGIWIASWGGLGRIDRDGVVHDEHVMARAGVCLDRAGRLWAGVDDGFVVRLDGRFEHYPVANPGEEGSEGCAPASDGGVWLSRGDGLFHAPPTPRAPDPVAAPDVAGRITAVGEDRGGRVWLARGDFGCWADANEPIRRDSWTCRAMGGAAHVYAFIETERGHVWAAANQIGVVRFDEETSSWRPIPGTAELASRDVLALERSPRGGVWIAGSGVLLRVLDRPDLPAGWQVVETPGTGNGLYSTEAEDVFEERDGTLWISQNRGVQRVPVAARDKAATAPTVALIGVAVDGHRVSSENDVELPSGEHLIEFELSALSFRDPSRVRYRVRLTPTGEWSAPTQQPSYRFLDLPPGDYSIEATATLDGTTWSAPSPRVRVTIAQPWYLRAWAIAAAVAIAAAAIYTIHRVRLAVALRLERQRSRIAMDLHDEMGSALGSIGILAELAGDDHVEDGERRRIAGNIAETAEELSDSLGDIVWSLRERSATIDALVAHVRERANRMFSARTDLAFVVPATLPPTQVSLAVRSNVSRIAFEALHNAAKHASASRVVVAFEHVGARWRMTIEDDGVGLSAGHKDATGLGLASMRKRADEIGASLVVERVPAGGTRVALLFAPGADA
jgi:signal transduction histidine kinase/ligand-binding sensor domain-containing protein